MSSLSENQVEIFYKNRTVIAVAIDMQISVRALKNKKKVLISENISDLYFVN